VIDTPVAIGSQENPTPAGDFYVTDVIDTANAGGAYGPYALGLSAHSETLSEFAGGDGEIGLHGTNQPASIGNAVSHGCVRVPNDVVVRLVGMLALGSPVTIR
jgi:lipoprotein-anchoring transpeptidase ErfK/SrfK